MRSILVLNPKGGCGKTTIATNLAGYYADRGKQVGLVDLDPQGSSADWVRMSKGRPSAVRGARDWWVQPSSPEARARVPVGW